MNNKKLGLGTVQFGSNYGISNTMGKTPPGEVADILALAKSESLLYLDTARQYGESELVLGECLARDDSFRVVTKIPPRKSDSRSAELLVQESLSRLKKKNVYGILIHHCDDLLSPQGPEIWRALEICREKGLVEKIGVSAYDPEQLERASNQFPVQLVQMPLNVFDQRLLQSGHLNRLKKRNVEVHIRSVFLQGLLLMDPRNLPPPLKRAELPLRKFQLMAQENNLSPLEAALLFVHQCEDVDAVICGVNTANQLEELIGCLKKDRKLPKFNTLRQEDPSLLNPALWGTIKNT